MTATFIELHIDGNGPILIDIMDISRVGPAQRIVMVETGEPGDSGCQPS